MTSVKSEVVNIEVEKSQNHKLDEKLTWSCEVSLATVNRYLWCPVLGLIDTLVGLPFHLRRVYIFFILLLWSDEEGTKFQW